MSYLDGLPEFPPMVKAWQAQRQLPQIPGQPPPQLNPIQVAAQRRPLPAMGGGPAPQVAQGPQPQPQVQGQQVQQAQAQPPYQSPVTPEMREAALRLGMTEDELMVIMQQMQLAQELRQSEMPEGRRAGRTFVAANPLEFLSTGINRARGNRDMRTAQDEQTKVLANQQVQMERLMKLLYDQKQMQGSPAEPAGLPPGLVHRGPV